MLAQLVLLGDLVQLLHLDQVDWRVLMVHTYKRLALILGAARSLAICIHLLLYHHIAKTGSLKALFYALVLRCDI